jgi:hypothetical protein
VNCSVYQPRKFKKPTTTGNGAIADAKARVNNFLNKSQNPIATNVEKAAKETEAGLGSATGPNSASARANRELLGQDSTRVDEATKKVGALQNKLTNKALQAVDDVKNAAGQVQNAAPDVPTPSAPGLFKNLGSKIQVGHSIAVTLHLHFLYSAVSPFCILKSF